MTPRFGLSRCNGPLVHNLACTPYSPPQRHTKSDTRVLIQFDSRRLQGGGLARPVLPEDTANTTSALTASSVQFDKYFGSWGHVREKRP